VYIVAAALVVRVAAMVMLPYTNTWDSGAELANVARSLVSGQGFSSPFGKPTGATAWVAPVYPFLLAAIYKIFGVLSPAAGRVVIGFQVLVSALTCLPIVRLGEALGNRRVGIWAGWAWACFPYFALVPVVFIWDTTLSAFLLVCLLLATARLRPARTGDWALVGAFWAFAALTNPALLAILPVCLGWLWWRMPGRNLTPVLSRTAVLLLVLALGIAPWTWRNWKAFHTFVPLRSSFGEVLWLGNHPGGRGRTVHGENAYENPREFARFQQLGEIAYAKSRKDAALAYIAASPLRFVHNVAYRALYWWFGIGERAPVFLLYALLGLLSLAGAVLVLASRARAWYPIVFTLLLFPLTYYLTDVMGRYRHPLEPAMTLISAYFLERVARFVSGTIVD
jgi:4-amino-4-deoxy-L-arabinose transferase-like glycosyltransferase